jgi:hypothetical protein
MAFRCSARTAKLLGQGDLDGVEDAGLGSDEDGGLGEKPMSREGAPTTSCWGPSRTAIVASTVWKLALAGSASITETLSEARGRDVETLRGRVERQPVSAWVVASTTRTVAPAPPPVQAT